MKQAYLVENALLETVDSHMEAEDPFLPSLISAPQVREYVEMPDTRLSKDHPPEDICQVHLSH